MYVECNVSHFRGRHLIEPPFVAVVGQIRIFQGNCANSDRSITFGIVVLKGQLSKFWSFNNPNWWPFFKMAVKLNCQDHFNVIIQVNSILFI